MLGPTYVYKSSGFAKDIIIPLRKQLVTSLLSVVVYNKNGSALFLQLHDSATLPANTSVPIAVLQIPSQGCDSLDFAQGLPFSNGIVAALSTTDATLTITGTNDGLFIATYA